MTFELVILLMIDVGIIGVVWIMLAEQRRAARRARK